MSKESVSPKKISGLPPREFTGRSAYCCYAHGCGFGWGSPCWSTAQYAIDGGQFDMSDYHSDKARVLP